MYLPTVLKLKTYSCGKFPNNYHKIETIQFFLFSKISLQYSTRHKYVLGTGISAQFTLICHKYVTNTENVTNTSGGRGWKGKISENKQNQQYESVNDWKRWRNEDD